MVWILSLTFSLFCTTVASAQTQDVMPTPLLVDRDMSPAAGATATIARRSRFVAHVEDRFVPLRLVEDRGKLRSRRQRGRTAWRSSPSLTIRRRTGSASPITRCLATARRLRELFDGHIGYYLPAPPPYGRGGGATFFEFDRPPTVEEVLAVTRRVGWKRTTSLARALAQGCDRARARWHYRDARRYLYDEYDTIRYIRGTRDAREGRARRRRLHPRLQRPLRRSSGEKRLSARHWRRNVLVVIRQPDDRVLVTTAPLSRTVWSGNATAPVPMIHVGATRYLPMAHCHLTSFGTEFDRSTTRSCRNGRFYRRRRSVHGSDDRRADVEHRTAGHAARVDSGGGPSTAKATLWHSA